jgi:hypothetical protein
LAVIEVVVCRLRYLRPVAGAHKRHPHE